MARKKVTTDDKATSKAPDGARISQKRKMEILGIVIISIGVLIFLSIISYNENDYSILPKVTWGSIFEAANSPANRITNGLGPIGAWIAHFFVLISFGYASVVIPALMVVYGWNVFRAKELRNLSWGAVYSLLMMILFSVLAGWFVNLNVIESRVWTGNFGLSISSVMLNLLSVIGSGVVLFVLLLIALLFLIDRDIQVTIDRIKEKLIRMKAKASEKAENIAESVQQKAIAQKEEKKIRQLEERERVQVADVVEYEDKEQTQDEMDEILPDLEEVLKASQIRELKRKTEVENHIKKSEVVETDLEESESEPDVNVYVGEEEEQARKSDLKKMQTESNEQPKLIRYRFPTFDLLDAPPNEGKEVDMEEINENKRIILDKLKRHGIDIIAIDAIVGPTVTLYELTPAPDVKISKIESYANDLKMAMAAMGIRIIAPIPGKTAVGIEVPNQTRETVYIKQVINTKKFVDSKMDLPIAFGKTIENEVFMVDLAKCPHLLVAGATGSGKSVGINTIITCLLYKCHPDNLKFVLVDPKKIELALYKNLERHYLAMLPHMEEPIITDTSKVLETLLSVCKEMDDRYDLLKLAMVRDLKAYNEKVRMGAVSEEDGHRHLPYIVVIIDELADLMMTAGKQIEEPIARIAQLARAVGIHLVVATQRPSVNVITGTIKANFPSRIAYQVASKIDSRTILDTMGADQLVGRGDMLYSGGGPMIRVQNAFVSTEEVERITDFVGEQKGYVTPYLLPVIESEEDQELPSLDRNDRDALFEEAAKVVVLHQQGSVSLLQRKLRLGYNRAGRLIDQLYAAGIVGAYQGSTARDVLVQDEDELEEILRGLD